MPKPALSPIFDTSDRQARAVGIAAAVAALRAGELVGLPTETVYGLAADATNGRAVAEIFAAKGRPQFNPLIVHAASLAEAEKIAVFSDVARGLAKTYWPGPLTLVLPRREGAAVADLVFAGLDTIAVRVPAHPVAQEVLAAFGGPVAAPSANRSGHISPTTAAHVAADLGAEVACILDAGPAKVGIESTVVALTNGEAILLRPGAIARADVERVLGRMLGAPTDSTKVSAPGMLVSHYAPKAALRLDVSEVRPGEGLLAFGPDLPLGSNRAKAIRNLSEAGDLIEAAANLFAALRDLDNRSTAIAVMPIPDEGLGEAINDRLRRAAAPVKGML